MVQLFRQMGTCIAQLLFISLFAWGGPAFFEEHLDHPFIIIASTGFIGGLMWFHAHARIDKLSKQQMLIVDFTWLLAAGLAIALIPFELTALIAGNQLELEQAWLRNELKRLAEQAHDYANWYQPGGMYHYMLEQDATHIAFAEFVAWLNSVKAAATEGTIGALETLRSQIEDIHQGNREIKDTGGMVVRAIGSSIERAQQVSKLSQTSDFQSTRNLYLVIGVSVLPVALAMRLSKVSAEYFGWIKEE